MMTLPKFVRLWLLQRELDRNLRIRRIVRQERRNAALRGMGKV